MRYPHLVAAAVAIAALAVAPPATAKPGKCPKDPNPPTTRWLLIPVGTDRLNVQVDTAGNNNGLVCDLADPFIVTRHVIDDIAK